MKEFQELNDAITRVIHSWQVSYTANQNEQMESLNKARIAYIEYLKRDATENIPADLFFSLERLKNVVTQVCTTNDQLKALHSFEDELKYHFHDDSDKQRIKDLEEFLDNIKANYDELDKIYSELEVKHSELETKNMFLRLQLGASTARCQQLIERYRNLAKSNKQLVKQSLEDLRFFDIENNS